MNVIIYIYIYILRVYALNQLNFVIDLTTLSARDSCVTEYTKETCSRVDNLLIQR